jgi:cytochrome c553
MPSARGSLVKVSIVTLAIVAVVTLAVAFVWLPSVQGDYRAQGLWAAICRAAGVPASWGPSGAAKTGPVSTRVVLEERMAEPGASDAIGRGATLANLRCTMCHGPRGVSMAGAPNIAGQYGDVTVKQLLDFKHGDRTSAVMQSLASVLSETEVNDLAAYFSSLPKPRNTPVTDMSTVPQLVRTGDPLRNVAPCASCHGGIDRKLGAPWLEGMPKEYLVLELTRFASGERHNDSLAQMRNMARSLTKQEIDAVADFYARHGEGEAHP